LVGGVTEKVLTSQLIELEQDGYTSRKVYAEVPPKVEYSLTEKSLSLSPVLDAVTDWAVENF